MAFLQGGGGFHLLSASVYNYLAGMKVSDIYVNASEVADPEIQEIISQVTIVEPPIKDPLR